MIKNLAEAIRTLVAPGMHLHFASSPSRSNAAVRELARAFQGTLPGFVLSASGFHSTAHLLARLRLGRRYIACFYGDNYPSPKPNPLYQRLLDEGTPLHVLSLLSYVEAFRAGALGVEFATTRSLVGTDLARELEEADMYRELTWPGEARPLGLVRALRADIAFVHAPLADPMGNVVVSAPSCEVFWAARGARRGVVVTAEKLTAPGELDGFRDAMPIPRHQVLAVCEEPKGCHPQPLSVEPRFGIHGYEDDFAHYELWRHLATDDALFRGFEEHVLEADDGAAGYQAFVRAMATEAERTPRSNGGAAHGTDVDVELVLAARSIRERVVAGDYRTIIAGIGRAYFASRLAKLWLEEEGRHIDVVVETGLIDIPCGADGHDFLLSYQTARGSARVADAEDALATLACGAANRCLGVISAGQIDTAGAINSTRLSSGKFLVGSGGANDIASGASEVIVLARDLERLVQRVDHVTSPGHRVTEILTGCCAFRRSSPEASWHLANVYPFLGQQPLYEALEHIRARCAWDDYAEAVEAYAAPMSTQESASVRRLQRASEPRRGEQDGLDR